MQVVSRCQEENVKYYCTDVYKRQHFILGMTKQDIARAEDVHEKVVRVAIERGLRRLEIILKNSL